MKTCHISRFVSIFRGRLFFERKVSIFNGLPKRNLESFESIFSTRGEGPSIKVSDGSEVRIEKLTISSG